MRPVWVACKREPSAVLTEGALVGVDKDLKSSSSRSKDMLRGKRTGVILVLIRTLRASRASSDQVSCELAIMTELSGTVRADMSLLFAFMAFNRRTFGEGVPRTVIVATYFSLSVGGSKNVVTLGASQAKMSFFGLETRKGIFKAKESDEEEKL
ncbi:hypothetical protein PIB30_021871 [Stylosanthes scabra]|uniref:Uncharacterized protein n=1 Tax=Stylosanthes scabra TaxID=79078 RepID=A0ABU6R9A9_9FABA|nr:hypothetical protein [Stylosanthes scabra]